jgi:hypothetical protein
MKPADHKFSLSLIVACLAFIVTMKASFPAYAQDDLIGTIEKDTVNYFIQYADPHTGLVADSSMPNAPASIAATGFSLLAMIAAAENEWLPREDAFDRVKRTLFSLHNKVEHERGFFYHFISTSSGKRVWESEASSIDTALCIASALVAGQYFKDTIIEKLASSLYERVEWEWMLNNSLLFCHGYKPETGFMPYYWDTYSEHLILQALAIGAEHHAAPQECWNEWVRLEDTYGDRSIIYAHSGALFAYQFSHIFIDFRGLSDDGKDYFENSKNATIANRLFCMNNRTEQNGYSETVWGISASLGPRGYKAYGAKPGRGFHDGTIAPYAILCALPFTETEALLSIRHIYETYKDKIYGRCGFRDALNLDQKWFAEQYIGIDQGATVGMIENYRSGLIWKLFMELPSTKRWIEQCGLQKPPDLIPASSSNTHEQESTT